MKDKNKIAADILRKETANFFSREASRQSMITVIDAELSEDFGKAIIYLSVLPKEHERAAQSFANRNKYEFLEHIGKKTKLPRIKSVEFKILQH